jgi:hypothetical protein
MNIEFVLVLDTHRKNDVSADQLREAIESAENGVLENHREYRLRKEKQLMLFEGAREYGQET